MNNNRRSELKKLRKRLELVRNEISSISNDLQNVLSDEEFAYDNMPEGIQVSLRGMDSEDAIDNMQEANDDLENAIDLLNDIL